MNWTQDRIDLMVKLRDLGKTASEIACALGDVTRNAVIGKLHRLGHIWIGTSQQQQKAPKPPRQPLARPRSLRAAPKRRGNGADAPHDAAVPAPPLPKNGKLHLLELRDGVCKWPIGDPKDADFGFCGNSTQSVYCAGHQDIAYQRGHDND